MDFKYIGGSMGSVVGEKIARAVDHSIKNKSPLLIISKSEDGEIEAIKHKNYRWLGWMWHPEREKKFDRNSIYNE